MEHSEINNRGDETPKPFVFAPSQSWDGNDGRWSTFIVRVGTPEQDFRVLPSTSGHETFIPVPEGCIASDPADCGALRGAMQFAGKQSNGFLTNSSSTWKPVGLYTLNLSDRLGIGGNGLFGLDSVGLMLQNSGGLKLDRQVVAGIATKDFYLGLFGLGPKPSNFTDFENPEPAFMQTLKDQKKIPSLSFAYTAGAAYKMPQLPGSLTLGGYDASRFTPNDQTFSFSADDSRVLSVGLQHITAINTLLGSRSLLTSPTLTLIDSTVPHIWLPKESCDQFAEAFGLTYDSNTDLYLVNDTYHEKLRALQPTITFILGNDNNVAKAVAIQMPYGAFDLQASHPYYPNATNYFPIRRAVNDTQYTLGRTFLQEAYVIADYERSNFSIHQGKFESRIPEEQIVTITAPSKNGNSTSGNGNENSHSLPSYSTHSVLSKSAKAGIGAGVGTLAFFLLLFALVWFRRHKYKQGAANLAQNMPSAKITILTKNDEMYHPHGELPASNICHELDVIDINLMSDDAAHNHLHYGQIELSTDFQEHEMEGEDGSADTTFGRPSEIRHEMDGTSHVV